MVVGGRFNALLDETIPVREVKQTVKRTPAKPIVWDFVNAHVSNCRKVRQEREDELKNRRGAKTKKASRTRKFKSRRVMVKQAMMGYGFQSGQESRDNDSYEEKVPQDAHVSAVELLKESMRRRHVILNITGRAYMQDNTVVSLEDVASLQANYHKIHVCGKIVLYWYAWSVFTGHPLAINMLAKEGLCIVGRSPNGSLSAIPTNDYARTLYSQAMSGVHEARPEMGRVELALAPEVRRLQNNHVAYNRPRCLYEYARGSYTPMYHQSKDAIYYCIATDMY